MTKEQELQLTQVIVKVTAIERVMIKKGLISSSDLTDEMKLISNEVLAFIKANSESIFGAK